MIDFKGSRGSNTGDDFHELWATRQAIRLLSNEDGLEAIAVEGTGLRDEANLPSDTWAGVDCTQYFGGRDATGADHIRIEQLKYSAANPNTPWTVARLVKGRRGRSVIARLAKAWEKLTRPGSKASPVRAILITNQPIDQDVVAALQNAAASPLVIPIRRPAATESPEVRLAYATQLNAQDFCAFASALYIEAGAGSRFALEEQVLQAMAKWSDLDIQRVVAGLKEFIRNRMMPEGTGELITRESILLHLGVSEELALFPCPSKVASTEAPVSRTPVREAAEMLRSGVQYLCLHGCAGVGKTTALQEIEGMLPLGSIMVKFDCYGGGRYLDPSALRHRSRDAFIQLTNELAVRLRLPLLLNPHRASDLPRLFANRLKHAADALAAQRPDALIIVAVDAADNAVVAAQERSPPEAPFIHDFVRLTEQPENVRFLVTSRTGRRGTLRLPPSYCLKEIAPFSRQETRKNVARVWAAAPHDWVDDFHHFSNGVPRVQDYAFKVDGASPSTALDHLRPHGKSLGDIFRQQFDLALSKGGSSTKMARLCAALIVLPRPVPLSDLVAVLGSTDSEITDVCTDLAPGVRLQDGAVSFADEDFEVFVRAEGETELEWARTTAADWLLSRAGHDRYAALHVAAALVAAERGEDLLNLVEEESAPTNVTDPILRREAELQRVRLSIKVCREAENVSRALRFVLIGAEGVKTETAVRNLLSGNPDLAARFAPETARRLILSDADCIAHHGSLLFHKLSVDADRGDAISYRAGQHLLEGWLQARKHHCQDPNLPPHFQTEWNISVSDISAAAEAALTLHGPAASLQELQAWTPKRVALEVGLDLPYHLIAEGRDHHVEAFLIHDHLGPLSSFFLLVPLALAGRAIEVQRLVYGLELLDRRKLKVKRFFRTPHYFHDAASSHARVLESVLTACEILTIKGAVPELVDRLLVDFLDPEVRRVDRLYTHEPFKLDLLFRAYALREVRAGRTPNVETVFEARPTPANEDNQRDQRGRSEAPEQADRPLKELTRTVFGVYATIANALVHRQSDAELEARLHQAAGTLEREWWRSAHEHRADGLRQCAATSLLALLAAGHKPEMVMRFATIVHGRWRSGGAVPNGRLVARLSLWPSLHGPLLADIAAAVAETHAMRIGADEKSAALVSFARLIAPLSKGDAQAIFNKAVEVASELDHEVMAQIRLLDKLVEHGNGHFANSRGTARKLSNVVAEAAIRLEGHDHFPWERAMTALTRLDAPLALANAARWDDEAVASRRETIGAVLETGLSERTITPEHAAALSMLTDNGGAAILKFLKQFDHQPHPNLTALLEEAAYDVLMQHGDLREVAHYIEQQSRAGPWSGSLLRQEQFVAKLAPNSAAQQQCTLEPDTEINDLLKAHIWNQKTLLDGSLLWEAVEGLWDRIRTQHGDCRRSHIFESARNAVLPADRVAHLDALAGLDGPADNLETVEAVLQAIDQWSSGPAVGEWCRREFPEVIVSRFLAMTNYLPISHDYLTSALERTDLNDAATQDLLLKGLARHAENMGVESIFSLAGMIGCKLAQRDAAGLAAWYVERLENRIPDGHRDQTAFDSELPRNVDEAAARFLFVYMGDCDLRLRWRAAHAVRRLARIGGETTLKALVAEYGRREERVFRAPDFEFYWLAARLWFVLAWDRIAGEKPEAAAHIGSALLDIALDDSFPHLLVRSFARDACEKLVAAGHLSLTAATSRRLACVDETSVPRMSADPDNKKTISGFGHINGLNGDSNDRRFRFNVIDTLPYWYAPMVNSFAAVDGERFLREAERWIVDEWGYSNDIDVIQNRRRSRFNDRDWALSMNSHGSKPTLEPLRTHLEWHAMWCASGELLKTEPLVSGDEHDWNDLAAQINREKLVEPPLWSADLLVSTPLSAQNWRRPDRPLEDWVVEVREADHRAEIFSSDKPGYMVVNGSSERSARDRVERVCVSSALVEPTTGGSLVRALQTMEHSWDYKLPDEGEEYAEIDEAPFRFLGWLRSSHRDDGIDKKDPFRGHAFQISSCPGQRVALACNLTRDETGRPRWSNGEAEHPMFIYEAWGVDAPDGGQHADIFAVAGKRLVVHKMQLLTFLRKQGLNLIIKVEVERRERENRRYAGEEDDAVPEGRFARLYLLDGGENLEVAEGRLGTWTSDCPTA